MRSSLARSLGASFASLVVGTFASSASAQNVSDYNTYKFEHYTQTTATPPTTPSFYYCNFGFDTEVVNAFTTGTVTWTTTTGDSPAPLTLSGTDGSTYWDYWWPGPEVATKAALDATCPAAAVLTFAVSGGQLGTVSGTLTIPADNYASVVPAFDTATFALLTSYNPTAMLTVTTVAHPAAAGTQFSATYLSVVDAVTSATLASGSDLAGDGDALSVSIAANTLAPGHAYRASIDFTDRLITTNAGFGGASAFTAFEQTSEVDFTTLLADGGVAPTDAGSQDDATAPTDASVAPDATLPVDSGGPPPSDDSGPGATTVADDDSGAPAASAPSGGNSDGGGLCSASSVGAKSGTTGASLIALALLGLASRRRRLRARA